MTEPVWIDAGDALTLHALLLARHGGAAGVRDDALLQSADWRQLEFRVLPHLRIEPKLETCLIGNRTQFRTAYFFRLAETTGGVEGRNDKGIMCRSDHVKMTHLVK